MNLKCLIYLFLPLSKFSCGTQEIGRMHALIVIYIIVL
jgi:hypothetical protein